MLPGITKKKKKKVGLINRIIYLLYSKVLYLILLSV